MDAQTSNEISRFVQFTRDEQRGREYHICIAGHRRFTLPFVVATLIPLLMGGGLLAMAMLTRGPRQALTNLAMVGGAFLLLATVIFLYAALRRLKIRRGFASFTQDRVIYYEYCDHPHINYYSVQQVALRDISSVKLAVDRGLLSKSFIFTVWSPSSLALGVQAKGNLLSRLVGGRELEPAPDADEFIQELAVQVTTLRMQRAAKLGRAG